MMATKIPATDKLGRHLVLAMRGATKGSAMQNTDDRLDYYADAMRELEETNFAGDLVRNPHIQPRIADALWYLKRAVDAARRAEQNTGASATEKEFVTQATLSMSAAWNVMRALFLRRRV